MLVYYHTRLLSRSFTNFTCSSRHLTSITAICMPCYCYIRLPSIYAHWQNSIVDIWQCTYGTNPLLFRSPTALVGNFGYSAISSAQLLWYLTSSLPLERHPYQLQLFLSSATRLVHYLSTRQSYDCINISCYSFLQFGYPDAAQFCEFASILHVFRLFFKQNIHQIYAILYYIDVCFLFYALFYIPLYSAMRRNVVGVILLMN